MGELPLAPIRRIAKEKGGVERISEEAVKEIDEVIEDIAADLARDAGVATKHAGRVTVKDEDIRLVCR